MGTQPEDWRFLEVMTEQVFSSGEFRHFLSTSVLLAVLSLLGMLGIAIHPSFDAGHSNLVELISGLGEHSHLRAEEARHRGSPFDFDGSLKCRRSMRRPILVQILLTAFDFVVRVD